LYSRGPFSSSMPMRIRAGKEEGQIGKRSQRLSDHFEGIRKKMLTNSEGPHRSLLGVNLVDVGNPPGQVIHRHFIAVLVLELSSLLPCPGNLGVGIGCSPPQTNMQTKISFPELNPFKFKGSRERTNNAGHHTPDVLGDLEEVRDGGGIKQLVLEERKRKKEKNQGSVQEEMSTKRGALQGLSSG